MNKPSLNALLRQCEAIVLQEESMLKGWADDVRTTAGRKADCMRSVRFITIGFTAPLNAVRSVIDTAEQLPEDAVKRPPSAHSVDAVDQLKADNAGRKQIEGPVLPDGRFEVTLSKS